MSLMMHANTLSVVREGQRFWGCNPEQGVYMHVFAHCKGWSMGPNSTGPSSTSGSTSTHPLTHQPIYPPTHLPTYPPTHPPTHPPHTPGWYHHCRCS
jgi:hypothetical protein